MKYSEPRLMPIGGKTECACAGGSIAFDKEECTTGNRIGVDSCSTGYSAISTMIMGAVCDQGYEAAGNTYTCWGNGMSAFGWSNTCKSNGIDATNYNNASCWAGQNRQ